MSSENSFAYSLKYNTHFIVRNSCSDRDKTISLFHYPINFGATRDLLQIPGITESDIRASLLKGELRHKFLCGDIQLVSSNIDLLQFSDKQRVWLQGFGFSKGVSIGFNEFDGYVQSLFGQGGSGGITVEQHDGLHSLIHFIDNGPGNGFASGAYREITPTANPFPTAITWWVSSAKTQKLVEKLITYNGNNFPLTITWNMYSVDGITIIHTVVDTIVYNSVFEANRTRVIT